MVPLRHVLAQGPMLRALGNLARVAFSKPPAGGPAPAIPGRWIEAELPPRPPRLVRDYVAHVGGDPVWYPGRVPAHLFPQWSFPLAIQTLAGLPYAYGRAVNAGCRIEVREPLPGGEPLLVRARLETVDDDGRRVRIAQRVDTGTRTVPDAITTEMRVYIPLAKAPKKKEGGAAKAGPTVPVEAKETAALYIDGRAGLAFALLTGDFNPIHWVRPYARSVGFASTILHGFATLARAVEAMNRGLFRGDPTRLRTIDVRFTKPLVLPARVSVYTSAEGGVWVGDGPGGAAYLEGRFETTETN